MGAVILYEPDELMCHLLHDWLTDAGYRVYDAVADPPTVAVSLIIASISATGFERQIVLPRLQHRHPDAAVIVLCSQARAGLCSDGALARALGVGRVMAKPLRSGELLAAIATLIGPPARN